MRNDDLYGPTQMAASTLIALVMLHDDVRTPQDIITRAHQMVDEAFSSVLAVVLSNAEGLTNE